MALTVLGSYKRALLTNAANVPDLSSATLKWLLVTADHVADDGVTGDEFLDDILSANRVMFSEALASVSINSSNTLDADDAALLDTGNGRVSSQAYLYAETGVESTSRLIARESSAALTSDSTNDTMQHNASGIFTL